MREEDIEKMNFKQLRAEVQYLRDELALFKRKYEDAIYNLDSDNFGKSFTIEQDSMKTQIKVTADAIKTMVSKEDLQSAIEQSSGEISMRVENLETFKKSVFTQTEYGFTLDGEQTTFTGVIFLTDSNGNKRFSFFHDTSQLYEQVVMHSCVADEIPIVIGDSDGTVYIGHLMNGNEVATRNWVMENVSTSGIPYAVFG